MRLVGKYMDKISLASPTSARKFSPDEFESNELAAVLENQAETYSATSTPSDRVDELSRF